MSDKSGVLEMAHGKRMFTFPGPSGYEIKWGPGAVRIPLQDAMSKHAMIPCARFTDLKSGESRGGLPVRKMTFHATTKAQEGTADESSGQESQGASSSTHPPAGVALEPGQRDRQVEND